MPCNSDYLNATSEEENSKSVITLLNEVSINKKNVPYYGDTKNLDRDTALLCNFCQLNDVSKYSLELQIWWRDHQQADKDRLEIEQKSIKKEEEKKQALSKLTNYERRLLGI